jgi:hypothetical protein
MAFGIQLMTISSQSPGSVKTALSCASLALRARGKPAKAAGAEQSLFMSCTFRTSASVIVWKTTGWDSVEVPRSAAKTVVMSPRRQLDSGAR